MLFAKVLDVATDGTATLIKGQVAPIRIADAGKPVHVTLPGIVHRFAKGHQIRVVIAGASPNYRGGLTPTPVTIAGGKGQVLQPAGQLALARPTASAAARVGRRQVISTLLI